MEKTSQQKENTKLEIIETEKAFALMTKEQSIEKAFLNYAADNAVLNRQNKLIKGKDAIRLYLEENPAPKGSTLKWEPDFVDVSESGDMAYSYGQFIFTFQDTSGMDQKSTGIFHTVWKRQADGSWLYVWD